MVPALHFCPCGCKSEVPTNQLLHLLTYYNISEKSENNSVMEHSFIMTFSEFSQNNISQQFEGWSMANKNPQTEIGVQTENKRSKVADY